jgi:hypothetical protein
VEEVFSHRGEIPAGAILELKVFEAKAPAPKPSPDEPPAKPTKRLLGRGMLAGIVSSDEFMRRKHEETDSEDRPIR